MVLFYWNYRVNYVFRIFKIRLKIIIIIITIIIIIIMSFWKRKYFKFGYLKEKKILDLGNLKKVSLELLNLKRIFINKIYFMFFFKEK